MGAAGRVPVPRRRARPALLDFLCVLGGFARDIKVALDAPGSKAFNHEAHEDHEVVMSKTLRALRVLRGEKVSS
jgi:hypothetical protein